MKHTRFLRSSAFIVTLALTLCPGHADAAGPRTHAEMGWRAWNHYLLDMEPMLPGLRDFAEDVDAMRAFYCGCMFPDFGYDGINDDAAEYAHWHPFQEKHFECVKERYPLPWDAEARRHVAFFLGVLCHGVGDTPWHFDEWGYQSFLSVAAEHGEDHRMAEVTGDVFSHARFRLKPGLGGRYWWPIEEMRTVFEQAGVRVTEDELKRGCKSQERDWRKGATLGFLAYPYACAAYPWTRKNLEDFPYGGVENGAAYSASCMAYYYARLEDARFYQNIHIQSCAFPKDQPFLPCTDTCLCESTPDDACGNEPLLTLTSSAPAGRHACLLRFDMANWPTDKPVETAVLAVHLAAGNRKRARSDRTIAVYRVNRAWHEGKRPAAAESGAGSATNNDSAATWNVTGVGGTTWAAPGCEGAPEDREEKPAASAKLVRGDKLNRWLQWDITPLVQLWAEHPERNFGVLVRETAGNTDDRLTAYSSQASRVGPDGTPGNGGCVALRPVLIVRTRP